MLNRRLGISSDKVRFVEWAVSDPTVFNLPSMDGDYLYAAGWAHRDWATLLRALAHHPVKSILAPGRLLTSEKIPDEVRLIEMPSPEEGRALAAKARAVVVLLEDCEYAAGPLVLLDALAMGKPVIANDVNGNRDYVRPGVTAIVVPPGDEVALSSAIAALWEDPNLRMHIGAGAKAETALRYTSSRMWRDLLAAVKGHRA